MSLPSERERERSLSPNHNLNALKSALSLLEKTLPVIGVRYEYPGHPVEPIVYQAIENAVRECIPEIKWNEANVFPVTLLNLFDDIIGKYPEIWDNNLVGGLRQREMIVQTVNRMTFAPEEVKYIITTIIMSRMEAVSYESGYGLELLHGLHIWRDFKNVIVLMNSRSFFDNALSQVRVMNELEKINMLRDFILFLKKNLNDAIIRTTYRNLFERYVGDLSLYDEKNNMSATQIDEWRMIFIAAMRQAGFNIGSDGVFPPSRNGRESVGKEKFTPAFARLIH
jgi:hypothetical protein